LVPIAYYAQMCKDAFGIDPATIQPNIDETNILYGGRDIPATGPTNILFVNGNVDPWHSLGVTADVSDTVRAILIDGTGNICLY
jgi:serine protease 16